MDNNQVLPRSEIVIASSSDGFIGMQLGFDPTNPPLIDQFETALDKQLTVKVLFHFITFSVCCAQLRALDENSVIVGEEKCKEALKAFTKNQKKRKLPTEAVVALSFDVHSRYQNIFQEMENLVPRAKAQAKWHNRPWVPFHDRLDGWMIERRARTDKTTIKCDMYFHHKSGAGFKSKVLVTKFVLHNKYPLPTNKKRPRIIELLLRNIKRNGPPLASSPLEAPPSAPSAPTSLKRPTTENEQTDHIAVSQEDVNVNEASLTMEDYLSNDDMMLINEDGQLGFCLDELLEDVAREFEAYHQTISNGPEPTMSVTDIESENAFGYRVGGEAEYGTNLTVLPSGAIPNIEGTNVGSVQEETNVLVTEETQKVDKDGDDHLAGWGSLDSYNRDNGDLYSIVSPFLNVGPNLAGSANENLNPYFNTPPQFQGFNDGGMSYNYLDNSCFPHPSSLDFSFPGGGFNF
ncbi:hypothetical protein LINGRAHAP2_LOCUS23809 [Linum grandiflorum]